MAFKILVVDDEPSIVRLVSSTLTARGYEVITAHDGMEAITEAKVNKPITLEGIAREVEAVLVGRGLGAEE